MPCKQCMDKGKRGWKWGNRGKCYTGPGARAKCERQGRAAFAAGYRGFAAPAALFILSLICIGVGLWLIHS